MPIRIPRKSKSSSTPGMTDNSSPAPSSYADDGMLASDDELMTIKQAARFAGYAEITVRRWINDGILRARCARAASRRHHRRIAKSDLLKLFSNNDHG